MISLGRYHTLTISSEDDEGFFLASDDGYDVRMPRRFIKDDMAIGQQVRVFVYSDTDDIDIASTETPFFTVNQFAYLEVTDVNQIGAFCYWGLEKDLFIPFGNQGDRLQKGQFAIIYMYLDELTDRLVGTTKIKKILRQQADSHLKKGDQTDLLVFGKTDLGYKVIIDHTYAGLIFKSEVIQPLSIGQKLKGFIKPIRHDGKIDVSLQPIGHHSIGVNADMLLKKLRNNNGFLPYTDKSDAEVIRLEFGISKKLFKKAVGALYKQRIIKLMPDGIAMHNNPE